MDSDSEDSDATILYPLPESDDEPDRDVSVRDEEKGRRKGRHPELWDCNVRKRRRNAVS